MLKAFIFDIDGTLIDTRQAHIDSWIRAFREFGIDVSAGEVQKQFGRRAVEIASELLPVGKKDEASRVAEVKRRIYADYLPDVRAFSKARDILLLLNERGIRLALATSTYRVEAERYLDLLSADSIMGAVVAAEDIEHSKPDPEIFLKAAERLSVSPEESAGVGDSPHDMRAAKAAGMLAIGVLTGGYDERELNSAGADLIYSDMADLFAHVDEII